MKILTIIGLIWFPLNLFSQKSSLIIEIEGLENRKGNINLTLFDSEEGFPEDIEKALRKVSHSLGTGPVVIEIRDLDPGTYGFAILHDEDGNHKMNKNMLGIPKEGFAFSNNFKPRFSGPDFSDVSFRIPPGETRIRIEINYM